MSAKRTSPIWKIPVEKLINIVANNKTYKDILAHFDLENKGNNFKTLRQRMIEDGIDYSHLGKAGHNLGAWHVAKPLEEILVEGSTFNRCHLKRRLLKEGLIKNQCYSCGIDNKWNDKPLTLQLDHINGISNDNRLENLQMLCPNCHSQTDTFAGRQRRIHEVKHCECDKVISQTSERCKKCEGFSKRGLGKPNQRKVERPTKEELEKLVWEKPTVQIAKTYNVSEACIRKWRKFYDITDYPGLGYWQKKAAGININIGKSSNGQGATL